MIWGMMIIGTLYDVYVYQGQKSKSNPLESFEKNNGNGDGKTNIFIRKSNVKGKLQKIVLDVEQLQKKNS